jgi:acyl carrier protein
MIGTPGRTQQQIEATVVAAVARALDLPREDIRLTASLAEEYGAESLDILEIVFAIEKAFRIRLPKTNLMQHAQERFGDGVFLHQGQLTEFALQILRQMRPEIDPAQFRTGLRAHDVARLVTPQTFVRLTMRILDATDAALARVRADGCAKCGGHDITAADAAPEFVCTACGATVPTPSGDDILLQDLDAAHARHAS